MRDEGTNIRHIGSILVGAEEYVFSVYEGPSGSAISEFNQRADIPVSRMIEAVAMAGDQCRVSR